MSDDDEAIDEVGLESSVDAHVNASSYGVVKYVIPQDIVEGLEKDGFLVCNFCPGTILLNEDWLKRHLDSHFFEHVRYPFMCPMCGLKTDDWSLLEHHLYKLHSVDDGCKIISVSCGVVSGFIEEESRNAQCHICLKVLSEWKTLKHHLRTCHHNATPRCSVTECKELLTSKREFERHADQHINTQYWCEKCSFKTVNRHIMAAHIQGLGVKCQLCSKVCATRSSHAYHMLAHRSPSFECSDCHEMFTSSFDLQAHRMKQHNDNSIVYSCSYCSFTSSYRDQVVSHTRQSHEGGLQTCQTCGTRARGAAFVRHCKTHELSRPWACSECPFRAKREKTLKDHIRNKHVDEVESRRHVCPVCHCACKTRELLKDHMPKHFKGKTIECEHCSYKCRYRQTLHYHVKKYHPNAKRAKVSGRKKSGGSASAKSKEVRTDSSEVKRGPSPNDIIVEFNENGTCTVVESSVTGINVSADNSALCDEIHQLISVTDGSSDSDSAQPAPENDQDQENIIVDVETLSDDVDVVDIGVSLAPENVPPTVVFETFSNGTEQSPWYAPQTFTD